MPGNLVEISSRDAIECAALLKNVRDKGLELRRPFTQAPVEGNDGVA